MNDSEYSDFQYLFDSAASPSKVEIARQQIDGAIRVFLSSYDPIVVLTLLAPASQILRDLNKGNAASFARALHDLAIEANFPTSKLWKEFNDKSANYLKHANVLDDVPPYAQIEESALGALCFCIWEYRAQCGGVSAIMKTFLGIWFGASWLPRPSRRLWCQVRIWVIDLSFVALRQWLRLLLRMQQRMKRAS